MIRLYIVLLLAGLAVQAAKAPPDEFRARRAALRQSMEAAGDGVLFLKGQTEPYDPLFRFEQDPDFYYLTGWEQPGAVLLLTPNKEILFLPRHDARLERYHGRRTSAEDTDARSATGFDKVLPMEKLESELDAALARHSRIYAPWTADYAGQLRARYPFRELDNATPLIAQLRLKKSPYEIASIQRATDVSVQAHRAAWTRLAAGEYEYQIEATLVSTFFEDGCDGPAYTPIVGAGPDGPILHSMSDHRRMDNGQLVLIDAAAQCDEYASDITRTVPVNGKFTPRQREVYEVVLGAQKEAIAAVKPGALLTGPNSLTSITRDYINAHGKDLQGEPLGKYFTHDIGHALGLQVHDPPLTGPLEAGMVITIEPGVYIPEEQLGIRIEDVVLVTPGGAKVLSAALPKEPEEIEKAVSK